MKLRQRIITGVLVLTGLVGLIGCDKQEQPNSNKPTDISQTYFQDKGMIGKSPGSDSWGGYGTALGDIDGDGDLDLIVAGYKGVKLFENIHQRINKK